MKPSLLTAMVGHVIRDNLYSSRLLIVSTILVALTGLSLFALVDDYNHRLEDTNILSQSGDKDLLSLTKPSPLSVYSIGLSDLMNISYEQNFFKQISGGSSQKSLNRLFDLFDAPDSVYIFKIVVTLMAIFFVFDSITGERERGTMQVCFANPLPRSTFIMGKILGNFLSLAVPCVIIFIAGALLTSLSPTINYGAEDIIRLSLFLAVSLLLLAVFISLGVFVSALSRSSGRSMLTLIGIWLVFTYCIPNFASSIANAAAPVPRSSEINRQLNTIWSSGMFELLQQSDNGNFTAEQRRESNRDILNQTRRIEDDFFSKTAKQGQVFGILSRLSPVTAYVNASTTLLGAGIPDARRFREQLIQKRNASVGTDNAARMNLDYNRLSLADSINDALVDIVELLLLLALFPVLTLIAFNKRTLID